MRDERNIEEIKTLLKEYNEFRDRVVWICARWYEKLYEEGIRGYWYSPVTDKVTRDEKDYRINTKNEVCVRINTSFERKVIMLNYKQFSSVEQFSSMELFPAWVIIERTFPFRFLFVEDLEKAMNEEISKYRKGMEKLKEEFSLSDGEELCLSLVKSLKICRGSENEIKN